MNPTESGTPSTSNSPEALPHNNCSEPSGTMPDSTMWRTRRSVRYAVWLAGFTTDGSPARKAGASFSSIPHTGKLNALICTATPGRLV